MRTKLFLLLFMMLSFVGCSDGEEGLKEQTVIQSQEEINAQNQNIEEWAQKLQGDLDKRRAFISAVEGEFEGTFSVKESPYMIRVLISPTIPDYDVDRSRTLAELEYELQNLNLNIQIMQWNPDNQLSAVGCVLQDIKDIFNDNYRQPYYFDFEIFLRKKRPMTMTGPKPHTNSMGRKPLSKPDWIDPTEGA